MDRAYEHRSIKFLRSDISTDIGSHIRHHTISMWTAVGAEERVIAFESDSDRACTTKENIKFNWCENVKVIEAGLSRHAGSGILK